MFDRSPRKVRNLLQGETVAIMEAKFCAPGSPWYQAMEVADLRPVP